MSLKTANAPEYSLAMAKAVDAWNGADPRDDGPITAIVRLINQYDGDGEFTADELAGQFAWHIAQDVGCLDDYTFIARELGALTERGASFHHATALDHALLLGQHYF